MGGYRIERDSMGEVRVPTAAYYGAQTQRAIDNLSISSWRFGRRFIHALGLVKWAAAVANEELRLLDPHVAGAVKQAAEEVVQGKWDDQFKVDIFQTGSGTSTNMNANEVIANRANEILGAALGGYDPVHPNDQVNRCQSSNDVIPSAIHLSALLAIRDDLIRSLDALHKALARKSDEFSTIVKPGRTHLMDATPLTLGQEFSGFSSQIEHSMARLASVVPHLCELALGGTAVGTGLNAEPDFASRAIANLSQRTGLPLSEAANHFEAQAARDAVVETSGVLKTVAVSLATIANNLRWMASGPNSGLGEISLPDLQPGSSIMPGKINPIVPEAVIQVCAQVVGNDSAITLSGMGSAFQLNTMMPLMAYDLVFSIETLSKAAETLAVKCVNGIIANKERIGRPLQNSAVLVTALTPRIGYEAAAGAVASAAASGKSVKKIVMEQGLMTSEEIEAALDPAKMTNIQRPEMK